MANQELLNYLKQSLATGQGIEAAKKVLLGIGWSEVDINAAIKELEAVPSQPVAPSLQGQGSLQQSQVSNFQSQGSHLKKKIVFVIIIVLLAASGGGIYAYQKFIKSDENSEVSNIQTESPKGDATLPTSDGEVSAALSVLDCKNDLACLIKASENCSQSKVVYTATVDFFGVNQKTTSFFEIKGSEANKCSFYLITENIDLEFPANVSQEVVNEQKEIYKKLEGRNGTCKFNTADLTAMLIRWKEGDFESGDVSCELKPSGNVCKTEGGDFGVAECEGTYFEQPSL